MKVTLNKCAIVVAIALISIWFNTASCVLGVTERAWESRSGTSAAEDKTSVHEASEDKAAAKGLFFLYDGIDKNSVAGLIKKLEDWAGDAKHKGQPVRIVMNSPGGYVMDGFALMDEITAMRNRGHHVTIAVYGMAASAAGWILQAADTRSVGANSWLLIHQISNENSGKLVELQRNIQFTTREQDQFIRVLVKRSHLTVQEVHAHIDAGQDWWIPAREALKLGLVDDLEPVPAYK